MSNSSSLLLAFFLLAVPLSLADDPDMLQDLCVADLNSTVKVNGFACTANVTADDFFFAGLAPNITTGSLVTAANVEKIPGLNTQGSIVTAANVEKIPGLNTLGISMARIDYTPGGLNPPHTHPRATEMVFVLEGSLEVGFITTANQHVSKTIKKGEVFVFPRGLVHYQKNNCAGPAAVISAFNSQLQGTQSIASSLFTASPPVPDVVLAQAFQIGTDEVEKIKLGLAPKK